MKVVSVMLKYDYGIKSRGDSLEKKAFLPAICKSVDEVVPFWLEENGFPDEQLLLQDKIIKFVENQNPDVVFLVLMKDEVTVETIKNYPKTT